MLTANFDKSLEIVFLQGNLLTIMYTRIGIFWLE